jgi:hypothetical protein
VTGNCRFCSRQSLSPQLAWGTMKKIVATMFVDLNGGAEAPEKWTLNFWNDEISKFKSTWHRPRCRSAYAKDH